MEYKYPPGSLLCPMTCKTEAVAVMV